jgi:hypothetical protein
MLAPHFHLSADLLRRPSIAALHLPVATTGDTAWLA